MFSSTVLSRRPLALGEQLVQLRELRRGESRVDDDAVAEADVLPALDRQAAVLCLTQRMEIRSVQIRAADVEDVNGLPSMATATWFGSCVSVTCADA